jgi:tetratricopeptide (TPR) repeat protein
MGNIRVAVLTMQEAHELQKKNNVGSSAKADLDLLHMAITLSNYGYLKLNLKQYDEARAYFEEALLVRLFVGVYVAV